MKSSKPANSRKNEIELKEALSESLVTIGEGFTLINTDSIVDVDAAWRSRGDFIGELIIAFEGEPIIRYAR
jgi:hypothetical protein